jgi:iron complex transport system substrate-binding protein
VPSTSGTPDAKVVSLDPHTLDDVIAQIEVVAKVLDAEQRAQELTATMRARVARVKEVALRLPAIRVFCLEWSEPAFVAGHWIPEMVEAAGGINVLNPKGEPSKVVTWRQVRDENPEVIVFMPFGYYLEEAEEEGAALFQQPDFADTPASRNGNVFAVDATSFFSRLNYGSWTARDLGGHPEAIEPASGSIRACQTEPRLFATGLSDARRAC